MATATISKAYAVTTIAQNLLNPYEDFDLQSFVPGINGYVLTIRTNLMIHRKHTRKNVFKPHAVYQSTSMTALPNKGFLEHWIKNARQGAKDFINKGEYLAEIQIGKEWTSVKRHYNQWIYYDRKRGITYGKVTEVKRLKSRTKLEGEHNV